MASLAPLLPSHTPSVVLNASSQSNPSSAPPPSPPHLPLPLSHHEHDHHNDKAHHHDHDDDDDETFWRRMNSPDAQFDLPGMTSTPTLPPLPPLYILLATPAGKPLLHFSYPPTPPAPTLSSLSAASVAFHHKTHARTRSIRTTHGTVLSLAVDSLHISVATADPHASLPFLRALAHVAVSSVYTSLSAAFPPFLRNHPHAHPSNLAPAKTLMNTALLDVIAHPLPYALLAPVALPCPTRPSSRAGITNTLRTALQRYRVMTHAMIFTASPPYPRRIVSTVAPAHSQFSPMDILLLMSMAPMRSDERPQPPERFYLQADNFARASSIALRAVQLRLDPDDYDEFKMAVGGASWRPEWTSAGADVVWILGISPRGSDPKAVTEFLDYIEDALDRKTATLDLMVSMERPWTLSDISVPLNEEVKSAVRAVLLLDKRRIVGTLGSLEYEIGVSVLHTLQRWDARDMSVRSPLQLRRNNTLVAKFPRQRLLVVLCERTFAVCFTDSLQVDHAVRIAETGFLPWLKKFRWCLVPEHDRASIPPQTPLAGILSPFQS